ncbi:MAG: phage gp6-like head-tail connector protein [Alphaproteobacteria bacterium]|nr:phage gp6-like head-tail connector protein [Alphaproteobacteria bacterium]
MATGDLTTLANVKAWFAPPLTTTGDDALLTRLITAASQFIQAWLGRTVAETAYTETRNGFGGTRLFLRNRPVVSVASLTVDGNAIAPSSGAGQPGYLFDDSSVYLAGYAFSRGQQNVTIAYTAGYAATPPELEQACIALVALRYKERDRIGQVSKNLAGEVVSFTQKDMPADVQTLLDQYRSVVPA